MPIQQLPLMKGVGKDFRNADYIDYLPVNMLATPKKYSTAADIFAHSRHCKTFRRERRIAGRRVQHGAECCLSRVGGKLYKGESEVGDVAGSGRVSMAHGRASQAVGVNGQLVEYRYDGTVKTVSNWPTDSGFTQYELGSVRDITRLRGRYAWSKTALIHGLSLTLKTNRILTDTAHNIVLSLSLTASLASEHGETSSSALVHRRLNISPDWCNHRWCRFVCCTTIADGAERYCRNLLQTPFADSYAFISNPATGAPSVYIIGSGQVSPIASASIEKILRSYTADELADGVMESLRFDAHELLIIHLPRHVLVYDASSSANGPQWCVLKTGLYDDVPRYRLHLRRQSDNVRR